MKYWALLGMLRFYFVNVNQINNPIDVDVLEKLFQAPTCLVHHQHARFRKFLDVLCLLF